MSQKCKVNQLLTIFRKFVRLTDTVVITYCLITEAVNAGLYYEPPVYTATLLCTASLISDAAGPAFSVSATEDCADMAIHSGRFLWRAGSISNRATVFLI